MQIYNIRTNIPYLFMFSNTLGEKISDGRAMPNREFIGMGPDEVHYRNKGGGWDAYRKVLLSKNLSFNTCAKNSKR